MGTDDVAPDLNVPPMAPTSDERMWWMFCHLSVLLAHFAAGLTFIGPLVCWLIKKDQSAFVDYHGKEALNFQLNMLGYFVICFALLFCVIGAFLFPAVAVYNIVCVIIAGIKANNGELFRYPFILRIIK